MTDLYTLLHGAGYGSDLDGAPVEDADEGQGGSDLLTADDIRAAIGADGIRGLRGIGSLGEDDAGR
jgi:hypothetical protein